MRLTAPTGKSSLTIRPLAMPPQEGFGRPTLIRPIFSQPPFAESAGNRLIPTDDVGPPQLLACLLGRFLGGLFGFGSRLFFASFFAWLVRFRAPKGSGPVLTVLLIGSTSQNGHVGNSQIMVSGTPKICLVSRSCRHLWCPVKLWFNGSVFCNGRPPVTVTIRT